MSNIDMIMMAKSRSEGAILTTPLLSNSKVNQALGKKLFIKPECLQVTGSFKFRGAWSALSYLKGQRKKLNGVVAFSSGNHAQAVAAASKAHKVQAVIIMPKDAPEIKIKNTHNFGAEIILYDRFQDSREDIGSKISKERNLTLIKPYDESLVIAGQGTCGLEIVEQARNHGVYDAEVLVCCGGGGLSAGIALSLEDTKGSFSVRTCEPEFFNDTARSLNSGKREMNPPDVESICDAILTPMPGELTFPILKRLAGKGLVASDQQVIRAMKFLFENFKLVSEPGGAVALASALFNLNKIASKNIVVVVSGGNVDAHMFTKALESRAISL